VFNLLVYIQWLIAVDGHCSSHCLSLSLSSFTVISRCDSIAPAHIVAMTTSSRIGDSKELVSTNTSWWRHVSRNDSAFSRLLNFYARQHICYSAYMLSSVRLSVTRGSLTAVQAWQPCSLC